VLQASLRYGNLKDLQNQTDMASMAIAMLSRGVVGQSRKEFAEAMTALKATWSLQGGAEGLNVSLKLPADRFEEGLGLLLKALTEPAFDAAEFEELKASCHRLDRVFASRSASDRLPFDGRQALKLSKGRPSLCAEF